MNLSIATLSPDQRALAAELLYAHKMRGVAPGGKMPPSSTNEQRKSEGYPSAALNVLRAHDGWLRTRQVALLTGINQDSVSTALYRLACRGDAERRITSGGRAEWRAVP